MKHNSVFRFALGAIRYPSQAWRRLREIARILSAPSVDTDVASDAPPDVELIPVTPDSPDHATVIAMYVDNPSPYVNGPTSEEQLQDDLARGDRFYLLRNEKGEYVGVRGFDPSKSRLQNTVTDYRHRGGGYQLVAGKKLMAMLAAEGFTEFHSTVMKKNTRIQRMMRAVGWEMTPDPDNPDLIRAVLKYKK